MTAKTTASGVAYDVQGERPDQKRRDAAMQAFVREFARTAAIHMESCVRCGMCANACQFYADDRRSQVHADQQAQTVRAGLSPPCRPVRSGLPPAGHALQRLHRNAGGMGGADLRRLFAVRAVHLGLPDGHRHRRTDQGGAPRHVCRRPRARPPRTDGPHGQSLGQPGDARGRLRRHRPRDRRGKRRARQCRSAPGRLRDHRGAGGTDRTHQGAHGHRENPQQDGGEAGPIPPKGSRPPTSATSTATSTCRRN